LAETPDRLLEYLRNAPPVDGNGKPIDTSIRATDLAAPPPQHYIPARSSFTGTKGDLQHGAFGVPRVGTGREGNTPQAPRMEIDHMRPDLLVALLASASNKPVLTYVGNKSATDTTATTFTMAAASLGNRSDGEVIVVFTNEQTSSTRFFASATVDGKPVYFFTNDIVGAGPANNLAIGFARDVTSTIGDVVMNMSGSITGVVSCSIYRLKDLNFAQPRYMEKVSGTGATIISRGVYVRPGGVALYAVVSNSDSPTFDWTNATEQDDFAGALAAGRQRHSTATRSTSGIIAVTATLNGGGSTRELLQGVSW